MEDLRSEPIDSAGGHRPSLALVMVLLTLTALTFSYLAAYAVTGALVSAELLKAWPMDSDPRPKWLLIGFVSLMGTFTVMALLVRLLGGRHLKSIDDSPEE